MSFMDHNTEVVFVPRRVIKRDLIAGVPRTAMPEYRVWTGMLARCSNDALKSYPRYGGRGIKVCDRWQEDFKNFYDDMGPRPSEIHSIDRVDNDGNYEPGNCRWATQAEQCANKSEPSRDNRYFWKEEDIATLKTMWARHYPVAQIAEVLGRSPQTVRQRATVLNLHRDASTTRLVTKHSDLAHILREKGREAFIDAVTEKHRRNKEEVTISQTKAASMRQAALAKITASKTNRSEMMKQMRAIGMNMKEIGDHFGISRERVRQIEARGWPEEASTQGPTGLFRKVSSTKPEVRAKKIDRLCRAWNRASREAKLMFLNAAPDFVVDEISLQDVETVSFAEAAE